MNRDTSNFRFLSDVEKEVEKARKKFPSSNLSTIALMEEVGELAKALLHRREGKATDADVYGEAVQVCAMALRIVAEGDASIDAFPYGEGK